jgi:polar amino acid transport system substrate-binding protein
MRPLFTAIVAGVCLLPFAASADGIVLYGNASQPPKAWLDNGTPRGFVVDAAALALTRAGYTVEIRLVPFERAMESAKTEGIMTGIFMSAERAKIYDYSAPLVADEVAIAVHKGSAFSYAKPEDLIGKRIGLQGGMYYGPELDSVKDSVTLDLDTNPSLRVKKLIADRIDMLVMNPGRTSIVAAVAAAGVGADEVVVLPLPLSLLQNHLIVGKGRADGPGILERVNKAIAVLQSEGAFAPIMRRYNN